MTSEISPELSDCAQSELDRLAGRAAELVAVQCTELATRWYERMSEDPDLAPWVRSGDRGAALANAEADIGRELAALLDDYRVPSACPEELRASARLGVSTGFPLWAALKSYRVGNAVQFESLQDAVERLRVREPLRRKVLDRGAAFMFEYADRCARWIEAEYARELEQIAQATETRQAQEVRECLAGGTLDGGALGYPMAANHLAVIAWGIDAISVRALLDTLGGPTLVVADEPEVLWGWVALTRQAPGNRLADVKLPCGARIVVGGPAANVEGFRQSHAEAQHGRAVALRRPASVTIYEDVALEALALADPQHARAFVARQLGPISGPDKRSVTLRETLAAYLAAGQQCASAAARLAVHERTVANRLRTIEARLDRPVHNHPAELDLALRLHALI